jgi:hypothetical protein
MLWRPRQHLTDSNFHIRRRGFSAWYGADKIWLAAQSLRERLDWCDTKTVVIATAYRNVIHSLLDQWSLRMRALLGRADGSSGGGRRPWHQQSAILPYLSSGFISCES